MTIPILSVHVRYEQDTVAARQRSRQIARLLGFDNQDQTRIATAVSEITRNAFRYAGGGKVEFIVEGATAPQLLLVRVTDSGAGIEDLDRILDGRYTSQTGMGLGILGARRLMDQFEIYSEPQRGTAVTLKKILPRNAPYLSQADVGAIVDQINRESPRDTLAELESQNQELLRTLHELRRRQEELTELNQELEDTNRGVVALYAELDEKADHLRRADVLKTKFLSNMSHEFRSPLNSILALSDLLLGHSDGPLNSEQAYQVGFIRKAAEDLYELVNDLLDLAKVEAGKVEVRPNYFEVVNLFGALRGMLRPLFLNQSVALTFDIEDNPPSVFSDEGKVSQILRNFISNALKFTERGEVRVAARAQGDRLILSVADTGIGIGKEDQDRIFQDFAQVDGPLQRKYKGTGLGLPLSRKLAHLLRGEVSVTSQLGQGSIFTLDIPLEWETRPPDPAPVEFATETGPLVLIVENRPDAALMYAKWLKGSGTRMVHAASIRDARFRISAERPAVVILDILLDGEDTWNLLASLKASPETSDLPIIVVSTIDDPGKAYHLGADEYLVKPVGRDEFVAAIRRFAGFQQPKILIIDDDEKDRYLLKHRLRGAPVEIAEAASGPDGISMAVADRPNLIFLDLGLPGMTGHEVLSALKEDPRTKGIPVIIHTSARLEPEERERLGSVAAAVVLKDELAREGALDRLARELGAVGRILAGSAII
ncbi:MAG: histidine kinase [Candidatus Solibacter sp.]|nr:histidine kinase [Candidatus Solibacter sp.]